MLDVILGPVLDLLLVNADSAVTMATSNVIRLRDGRNRVRNSHLDPAQVVLVPDFELSPPRARCHEVSCHRSLPPSACVNYDHGAPLRVHTAPLRARRCENFVSKDPPR